MYGINTGSLALEVEATPGSDTWTSVWSMSGDQGNAWHSTYVDLTAYAGTTIKLRFKGITGNGIASDMAIDNLELACSSPAVCPTTISFFPHTESFETGFGDWVQVSFFITDDFDWTRDASGTPTASTGPTTGSDGTYYLFTEASSQTNSTFIIHSPCYDLTSCAEPHFYFDYHMYGINMGSLALEVEATPGSDTWTTVWSMSGDQGNAWHSTYVDLSAYTGTTIKLRFKGITGNGLESDMAIDNLEFSCSPPAVCLATISSFPYSESFETGFGDWVQTSYFITDDYDWTRDASGTPTTSTGPTTGSDGTWYLFTEASSQTNSDFIINGPCFDLVCPNPELTFDYHMYGINMGSLALDIEATPGSGTWTTVWSLSGDQGNAWNSVTINLSAYSGTTIKIRFKGVTGNGLESDMAIDNIEINCICIPPADPANPTASVNICGDKTLSFTGSSGAGIIWYWQTTCDGTDMSNSSDPYVVSTSGTYYLTAYQASNTCWSTGCGSVTVTVEQIPATPTINDTTVCSGDNTFYAYGSGSCVEYNWYDASSGGTLLNTGIIYNDNNIANTSYYVEAVNRGTFEVTPAAANSYVVNHVTATGDDRAGIAITQDYLYVTGDANTARMDLPLSLLTATLFPIKDGLFSDLSNGDLWVLYDGSAEISGTVLTGYVVNSLRLLNTDLAYIGTTLTLSSSFTLGDEGGIYAGKGFVIIQDGDTDNFYHIDLSTGTVTSLGIFTATGRSTSTEAWATWGIAEYNGCDYSVLYVDNVNDDIIRLNLSDGVTTIASSFTNLIDMSNITLSTWEDRWYFHNEGTSEFGGSDEVAGYADATITETTGNCSSARDQINVTVTPAPLAPDGAAYPPAIFPGDDVILSATGSGTLTWYDDKCEGNVIGTGASITVTPPYSTNYFVSSFNGCYSECDTVPVQVVQPCGTIAYANGIVDTIQICAGDIVDLSAIAGCDYMMMNDFNDGTIGVGWTSSCSPMFNNPCDPSPNGTIYLWIGNDTDFPRELVTQEYIVTDLCQICFDMDYATQAGTSPCEGIDLPNEGVHLQWSTDGGATWTDINYWDPLGGYDPQMITWNNYCEFVPTAAASSNTQFRFFQDVTSGFDYDHWGLDNVEISCPGNGLVVQWSHGPTDLDPPVDVFPTTNITYTVIVDDGFNMGNADTASVFIEVIGTPIAIDDQICTVGGSAILTASGGTNYAWYDAPTGGNLVGIGSTLTINPLMGNETYWVEYDIPTWGPVVYDFNNNFDGWTASAPCAPVTTWVTYNDGTEIGIYAEDLISQTSQLVLSPVHDVSMYDGNILFSVNHRFDTESGCDEGYIAYKLDGGPIQRLTLTTGSYTGTSALSLDPSTCANSPSGEIYSGLQAAYVTHSGVVNVTGINNLEFAFLFSTDASVAGDGWYVNEVTVESTGGSGSCPNARAEVHATVGDLNADYSAIDVSCYGNTDGEATAIAVDGVGTPIPGIFSYNWPTGATVGTVTGLLAGTYNVTITDSYGCTAEVAAIVNGPPLPITIVDVTAISGSCNIVSPNNWVHIPNSADNTEVIASAFDATGGNDLFLTEAEVTIFGTVQYHNGEPYLQRVVRVSPISSGPAIVRIYFTNTEFLALQAIDPTILSINDLGVTKCDDAGSWTNCMVVPASFSVSPIGVSCYYAEVTVTSFSKFYIHKFTGSPLPVELIGFRAFCKNGDVTLNWSTSVEIDNDYFSVEKSYDLINFIEIADISGAGNSNHVIHYSHIDKDVHSSDKMYYRIKQTDFDGKTKYSEILSVTCKDNNINVYAFVDASSGNIVLKTFGIVEDDCIVYMIDYTGRTVIQKSLSLKNLENNIIFTNKGISAGLYNIVLQTSNNIITKQIVIPR